MPIYEFYCPDCHCLYNFFSRRVDTQARPACPDCARPGLERRVSLFAIARPGGASGDPGDAPDLDEARLTQALEGLAAEAGAADADDPRQMGRLVRQIYESTGLHLGAGMREALRRLEAGEDPERIEEQMGDALESEDPFEGAGEGQRGVSRRLRRLLPPRVDETLHEL